MNKWFKLAKQVHEQAEKIKDLAIAEGREMTEEEVQKVNDLMDKYDDYTAKGKAEEEKKALLERVDHAGRDIQEGLERTASPISPPAASPQASAPRVEVGEPNILADRQLGFVDFQEFAMGVREAATCAKLGNPFQNRKFGAVGDALESIRSAYGAATFTGEEGGFLIPPEWSDQIYERANELLPVLGQCDKRTCRGNSYTMNATKDHDRSSTTYRYKGLVVYWVDEGGQITRSTMKTREITFKFNKLAVLAFATEEELEDTVNYGQRLMANMAFAIGDELVEQIMFGNGVGKPHGALVSDACISITKETGQAAATIVKENVDKAWARIWSPSKNLGAWYVNPECIPQLEKMTMDVGTGGVPVWLPAGGLADAPQGRLKGKPLYETDHCEALGTAGDLVFADFSPYVVVSKGAANPKMAMSIHLRFDYDEVAFKATFRVDGRSIWEQALTPRKGSSTVSPWVKIAVRA